MYYTWFKIFQMHVHCGGGGGVAKGISLAIDIYLSVCQFCWMDVLGAVGIIIFKDENSTIIHLPNIYIGY